MPWAFLESITLSSVLLLKEIWKTSVKEKKACKNDFWGIALYFLLLILK